MSTTEDRSSDASGTASAGRADTKLEVLVIPVSDVDRGKEFYGRLGWRLDSDACRTSSRRCVVSSVSTVPGPITLTRTRRDSSSCRSASANPVTPNFVMLQTLLAGRATRRVVELIVTRSATPRGESAAARTR